MSKKAKAHRKKVAARNQRNANKNQVKKALNTGMATPIVAHAIGKAIAEKGQNPVKVFNRRTQ